MANVNPKQQEYADGDDDEEYRQKRNASSNRGAAQGDDANPENFKNKYLAMTSKDTEGGDSTPTGKNES